MADTDDLPYRAEYAKSGRAKCKGCKDAIAKDSLRLAVMIQSPHFDGKMPNWFHYACFFMKQKVKNVGDIAHFESLRWEDQQNIKKRVDNVGATIKKEQSSSAGSLEDYNAEYAKSSRSVCRGCGEKILKGVLRLSRKEFDSENARRFGPVDLWYHSECFIKDRVELDFYSAGNRFTGYGSLTNEDQRMLTSKLPELKTPDGKKRAGPDSSTDATAAKKPKKADNEEQKNKTQNELLFKYRDQLKAVSKRHLQTLLEFNDQEIASGESRLLDRLADGLAFGALERCSECGNGQLVYQREGYRCHGNMTDWTACMNITQTPKRIPFHVPDELKEEYPFLNKYKYKAQQRFFPKETALVSTVQAAMASSSNLPLKGLKFAICGKLSKPKAMLTNEIQCLGGKISDRINDTVAALISSEGEVKKMSKVMLHDAKDADIFVVSDKFIDEVKNGDSVVEVIKRNNLGTWGSEEVLKRKFTDVVDAKSGPKKSSKSGEMFTKNVPQKRVVNVKGGAAVDPDSELEDIAHVLEGQKGEFYDAVLGLVDIVKGTNSYYKLQLLESDKGNKYWLFRAWGRVGTTIGGNKTESFSTRTEGIESFCSLYEEKTGNAWSRRKNFIKYPKKFYPVDIDYGQDDDGIKNLNDIKANSKSKLHKAIQDLVCMFFDVETMKKTMIEFEIDLKKMPLGKLSRRQIENAYSVLTELQQLSQSNQPQNKPSGSTNKGKILDASNRFYTLIPHDFGLKKPTPLDNEELINQKIEMLDNLLEIEIAYNILKTSEDDTGKDPLDVYYEKLKTDVSYLEKDSDEFRFITKYVENTHAATHNQYTLEVLDVFKIKRQGEDKRFKPFRALHNRQLLWHGSRVTNYAGILSQGLRIAPPEAPVTGYMFGKGIYFADMVSKSANYCHTNKSNPVGVMLLSEVALGNMHELENADFITKLPPGKHSTKGVGRTHPDPTEKIIDKDGIEIPCGRWKNSDNARTSLLYNEYIVYDVAQVNIKYLLKLKFNWKF